jgi:hypothetical protein
MQCVCVYYCNVLLCQNLWVAMFQLSVNFPQISYEKNE